jgi:hypothetical protein
MAMSLPVYIIGESSYIIPDCIIASAGSINKTVGGEKFRIFFVEIL